MENNKTETLLYIITGVGIALFLYMFFNQRNQMMVQPMYIPQQMNSSSNMNNMNNVNNSGNTNNMNNDNSNNSNNRRLEEEINSLREQLEETQKYIILGKDEMNRNEINRVNILKMDNPRENSIRQRHFNMQ